MHRQRAEIDRGRCTRHPETGRRRGRRAIPPFSRLCLKFGRFWFRKCVVGRLADTITGYVMRDVPIEDPPVEDLGPAMLACTPTQRRFVIGWIKSGGKNAARVARAAGYSDHLEAAKVQAHRALHSPRVQRALHEEAGRRLDGVAALAVAVLETNLRSSDPKARQAAADSILDRTGYARRTEQAVQVEHKTERRSYDQLLAAVKEKLGQHKIGALPAPEVSVDAEFKEVPSGEPASV